MIRAIAGAIGAAVSATMRWSRAPAATSSRVLVPRGEAGAIVIARRLLAAIEACAAVAGPGADHHRQHRPGHSDAPQERDFDALLSHADAACFAAKELGGNRFHVSYPSSDEVQAHSASMRSALHIREVLDASSSSCTASRSCRCIATAPATPFRSAAALAGAGRQDPRARRIHRRRRAVPHGAAHRPLRDRRDAALARAQPAGAPRASTSCGINLERRHPDRRAIRRLPRRTPAPQQLPGRRTCAWKSPRPAWSATASARSVSSARCATSAAASPSTISAPASVRSATCNDLDVDSIKIDGSFVRGLDGSSLSRPWCVRSPTSPTCSASAPSPSRSRPKREHARLQQMQRRLRAGLLFGRPQSIDSFFATQAAVA